MVECNLEECEYLQLANEKLDVAREELDEIYKLYRKIGGITPSPKNIKEIVKISAEIREKTINLRNEL